MDQPKFCPSGEHQCLVLMPCERHAAPDPQETREIMMDAKLSGQILKAAETVDEDTRLKLHSFEEAFGENSERGDQPKAPEPELPLGHAFNGAHDYCVVSVWRLGMFVKCAEPEAAHQPAPSPAPGTRWDHVRPSPEACPQCGGPVEEARRCYDTPVCYKCLPPPPPLPVTSSSTPSEPSAEAREWARDMRAHLDTLPDHYEPGADGGQYRALHPLGIACLASAVEPLLLRLAGLEKAHNLLRDAVNADSCPDDCDHGDEAEASGRCMAGAANMLVKQQARIADLERERDAFALLLNEELDLHMTLNDCSEQDECGWCSQVRSALAAVAKATRP